MSCSSSKPKVGEAAALPPFGDGLGSRRGWPPGVETEVAAVGGATVTVKTGSGDWPPVSWFPRAEKVRSQATGACSSGRDLLGSCG